MDIMFLSTKYNLVSPSATQYLTFMNLEKIYSKSTGGTFPENVKGSNISKNLFKSTNQHSNFLYVYFWYAYILLLSPFRFRKKSQGGYVIHRWFPQKLLCGASTVLCLLRMFTTLRQSFITIRDQDPVSFFLLFCECSSFAYKMTTFYVLWTNSHSFERLINFLSSPHLPPYNPNKMASITTISLFCGTYALLSFLRMALGNALVAPEDWSLELLYRRLVAEARFTFFLSNVTSASTAIKLEDISTTDNFLSVIQALSMQVRFITGFFVDLFILIHVLSLWAPASGFASEIYSQLSDDISGDKVRRKQAPIDVRIATAATLLESNLALKQFEALKTLSILVGETVGNVLLPYIGEALFSYAITFDSVIINPDIVSRIVLIFFNILAVCILLFSAETVRKMRWFKTWLGEKGRLALLGPNELAMILDDLACHSVGITASGIFIIDYTFVGTVGTVLITYFIIRLQSTTLIPES